jgi:o-succinylbenzoate synthase
MPIHDWRLIPYQLPLKLEWQNAQGNIKERVGWLVCLADTSGLTGYGDCAPLPQAGTEPPDFAKNWLMEHLRPLRREDAKTSLDRLPPPGYVPPAAYCGLETALLDLSAKQAGTPLAIHLNPAAATSIPVSANIGPLTTDTSQHAHKAITQGFHILKLKVGLTNIDEELRQLHSLADGLPPHCQLRLDASLAWSEENAHRFITGIKGLPIESLEEPLQEPNQKILSELQHECSCSLALEESLECLALDRLLQEKPVRRLILKPMVRGGLRACLDIAQKAHAADMEVVVTSTLDSAAGVWAATQLAAAISDESTPVAHGLASAAWLSEDLGKAPTVIDGRIQLPTTPGLGFEPYKKWLATLARN